MWGTLSDDRIGLNLLVQLLLGLARAVTLGSKFRRTHDHILLSHLRLPQLGEPGSPRNRVAQLYHWAEGILRLMSSGIKYRIVW
jgi:hypothetical protein